MATNFYFNNFNSSGEQELLEDLIIEAIQIYGENIIYIPRKVTNFDQLYTADDQSVYDTSYEVEMYIKSVNGFTGDGNFMSKFGLEIRDQVVFSVAQRTFLSEVAAYTTQLRPNEGDIIYFPLNQKCFQIKSVTKLEMFYQLGGLQTWEMTCELFEYSNEVFNTGIPEIDILQTKFSTNVLDYSIRDQDDVYLTDEDDNFLVVEQYNLESIVPGAENETLNNGSNNFPSGSSSFIDFSVVDPFSEGVV
jgi:Virus neck protein